MDREISEGYIEKETSRIAKEIGGILKKYSHGVIKDDGLEDALNYATLVLELKRVQQPDTPPEKLLPEWVEAEQEAYREGGNVEPLRQLIQSDSLGILEIAEWDEEKSRMSEALMNLALSI
jgi:hypothetical protein